MSSIFHEPFLPKHMLESKYKSMFNDQERGSCNRLEICRGVQLFSHKNMTHDISTAMYHPAMSEQSKGTVAPEPLSYSITTKPNPFKARCDLCYLAYRSYIKYEVCMEKCSSQFMLRQGVTYAT
jgi:hypothetical protein